MNCTNIYLINITFDSLFTSKIKKYLCSEYGNILNMSASWVFIFPSFPLYYITVDILLLLYYCFYILLLKKCTKISSPFLSLFSFFILVFKSSSSSSYFKIFTFKSSSSLSSFLSPSSNPFLHQIFAFIFLGFTCHESGAPCVVYAPGKGLLLSGGRRGNICILNFVIRFWLDRCY